MKIYLSPVRSDDVLSVSKAGDVLTINGEAFDFSIIPDGATIPAEDVGSIFVIGEVSRIGGELELTMILPHGPYPPEAIAFPAPLLAVPDGEVAFPGAA